jgi:hypothetical protein
MSPSQLEALFESAEAPDAAELLGEYRGVLLTGQFPPSELRFSLRLANGPWLPWKGKVFSPATGDRGGGANRFVLAGRKLKLWPFETHPSTSRFGGRPVLEIDYDIPKNSRLMRRTIFDELKRVGPNLYLGKGGVSLAGRHVFVFLWAIEGQSAAEP